MTDEVVVNGIKRKILVNSLSLLVVFGGFVAFATGALLLFHPPDGISQPAAGMAGVAVGTYLMLLGGWNIISNFFRNR